MSDIADSHRFCADVVRTQARNFWYGIRLLPPVKRRALSAVYAFARRVDDIADGSGTCRLDELHRARLGLFSVSVQSSDPVLVALADSARRLPIPLQALEELIDGCEADVRGVSYDTFDALVGYCRQVAGSVGRVSLGVFGAADPRVAAPLADTLGIALQLTNILRDVREDRDRGRIYLPEDELAAFGVSLELGPSGFASPALLAEFVSRQALRAQDWYSRGLRLLPLLDRRSAACCGAMAGIYLRLLRRIMADPAGVTRGRVSVPVREKAGVAARSLMGMRPVGAGV